MKRKLLLVAMIFLFSAGTCFADTLTTALPDEPITPAYVSITRYTSSIEISGSTASYDVVIYPKAGTSISKVVMNLKLVNGNGTAVQTKIETIYPTAGYFKASNSKALTARGSYHVEFTAKMYNGTALLETINGSSLPKTY